MTRGKRSKRSRRLVRTARAAARRHMHDDIPAEIATKAVHAVLAQSIGDVVLRAMLDNKKSGEQRPEQCESCAEPMPDEPAYWLFLEWDGDNCPWTNPRPNFCPQCSQVLVAKIRGEQPS